MTTTDEIFEEVKEEWGEWAEECEALIRDAILIAYSEGRNKND